MRRWTALAAILATGWAAAALGQALPEPTEWTVGGVKRQAIVLKPERATEQPAPLLFVFHGHGGAMRNTARLGYHKAWPEAPALIVRFLKEQAKKEPAPPSG
jgi:polyhydroxybutyrate depolymerase